MQTEHRISPLVVLVIVIAALLITLLATQALSDFLTPVLLAAVIAVSVSPLLQWLMKRGVPGLLALSLTICLVVAFLLVIIWLVSMSVRDFAVSLPLYQTRIDVIEQTVNAYLTSLGVDVNKLVQSDTIITPEQLLEQSAFISGLISGLSNWGLVLIATVVFLLEATVMPKKVDSITSSPVDDMYVKRILRLNADIRQFMQINAGAGLIVAAADIILLLIIGVDYVLLWGMLAFFLSFIPTIGFILSMIPPAVMALLQYGQREALIVIVGYVIIYILVQKMLRQQFLVKTLSLSPSAILLGFIIWGWALGPVGAVLSIPLTLMVQAVLENQEQTRWVAYILGDGSRPFQTTSDFHVNETEVDDREGQRANNSADHGS